APGRRRLACVLRCVGAVLQAGRPEAVPGEARRRREAPAGSITAPAEQCTAKSRMLLRRPKH
ncbi:MAG: hypothetical protein U9Q98_04085, partial [Bacteroidota bacterium]|nr:hypothetical protein [Bacteroidota bacterium]